jgi:hypothetical protein
MDIITDLPDAIGTAIGLTAGSSDSLLVGGLILSCAIVFGAIMVLNTSKKLSLPGQIFGILGVSGCLTAIGWMPGWILITGFIVIGTLFAGTIKNWMETR